MMSCEQHDYVEIACMYRYLVKLSLKSGAELQGIALDTRRNAQQQECIVIGEQSNLIPLDSISSMAALGQNPHFQLVRFD